MPIYGQVKTGPNIDIFKSVNSYDENGRPVFEYNFEHHPGSEKSAWIGQIDAEGQLQVHKVGGFEYETVDYGIAPKDPKKAIKKILDILKNKHGIEIGKVIKFRDGLKAEQTLSEYSGKAWAIMDEFGDTAAMYYPKEQSVELSQTMFGDGSGDEVVLPAINNIQTLEQAIFAVWLKLQKLQQIDEVRKLVQEVLLENSTYNQNDSIEWINQAPKEWYAVQKNSLGNSIDNAIGYIDKNLLYAIPDANSYDDSKWKAIEPFYGENFEGATELLIEYFRDNYKVDIGKRYELTGGIYAIEWYHMVSAYKYFKLHMEDGQLIGTYYPRAKQVIIPMPNRIDKTLHKPAADINQAAYLAFMNSQEASHFKKK